MPTCHVPPTNRRSKSRMARPGQDRLSAPLDADMHALSGAWERHHLGTQEADASRGDVRAEIHRS